MSEVYLVLFCDFTGQSYPDSIWDTRSQAQDRASDILDYSHILSTNIEKFKMNIVESPYDHDLIEGLEAEYE